jgi:hypothetical protein
MAERFPGSFNGFLTVVTDAAEMAVQDTSAAARLDVELGVLCAR